METNQEDKYIIESKKILIILCIKMNLEEHSDY